MYVQTDFPEYEDGAARPLGFDFGLSLDAGDFAVAAVSSLVCVDGADPALALDPLARFIGGALLTSTYVTQGLVFDDPEGILVGNTYALAFYVTAGSGQVIAPWSRFQVVQGYGAAVAPTAAHDANLTTFVLGVPPVKTILSSIGGYAGQDFPNADPGERWLYGFDLSPALSTGEIIDSVGFALTLVSGTDTAVSDSPGARFLGSPTINGSTIRQLVAWPLPLPGLSGNNYVLSATAQTSFNQAIPTWSRIAISSVM